MNRELIDGGIACAVFSFGMFAFWDRRRFYRRLADSNTVTADDKESYREKLRHLPWPYRKWAADRLHMIEDPNWTLKNERLELFLAVLSLLGSATLLITGLLSVA